MKPSMGVRKEGKLKEDFLQTGRLPIGVLLRKGIASLVLDPVLLVVRYMPGPLGFQMRKWYYKNKLGYMGKGVMIDPGVDFSTPSNIYLDDFCYIGRNTSIYCPEGYVKIGKRCHISGWILGHGGVEIGDYVGSGGRILSITDSHDGGYRMSGPMVPIDQRHLKKGKIFIGKDAFIGQDSMIMPGVTIGEGAVVGPFSYVFRKVAPWTVVVGNPARVINVREPVKFGDID
jgi:Acetyltransferase (isoleucine patch superfamily)